MSNNIKMKFEAGTCENNNGADYARLPNEQIEGWEDEPIYLCDTHSIGHQLIKITIPCFTPNNR